MKRYLFVVITLLLLLMPVTGIPQNARAAAPPPSPANAIRSGGPRVEVVNKRDRQSRTYLQDGHYVTQLYAGSVNYKDG